MWVIWRYELESKSYDAGYADCDDMAIWRRCLMGGLRHGIRGITASKLSPCDSLFQPLPIIPFGRKQEGLELAEAGFQETNAIEQNHVFCGT